MPRGLLAEFVPSRSGAYRITTRTDYTEGLDGWIFNENREIIFDAETAFERTFDEAGEIGKGTHKRVIVNSQKFLDKAYSKL